MIHGFGSMVSIRQQGLSTICQLWIWGSSEARDQVRISKTKQWTTYNSATSRFTVDSPICHESCDNRSSREYLPIPFGKKVRESDNKILCQNTRHRLTDLLQCLSICWHMITIQMCQRNLSICFLSCYDTSSTAHLPVTSSTETLYIILSNSVRIWDTACLFEAKPQLLPPFHQSSDASERLE